MKIKKGKEIKEMDKSKVDIVNNDQPTHTKLQGMQTSEHDMVRSRITGRMHEIKFGPQSGGKVAANPFASIAQAGYMHSHPEILGSKGLAEWDKASKDMSLPKHVKK
jgi:hypothetical protein